MRHPHLSLLFAALPALSLASSARADDIPQLGFEEAPDYYGDKEVALTFDDGPGWAPQHTLSVLDILKERGLKATFFINTGNQATGIADGNADSKLAVQRIVEEGHELGTHTLNHQHLITLGADAVATEINGVQDTLETLGINHRITLFRAPFGEPYQWKYQQEVKEWEVDPQVATYDTIAPLAAERYVHVGWNIDSDDWKCSNDEAGGPCLVDNIVKKLEGTYPELEGVVHHGNILMHSISARTAAGLPALLDYLEEHGYTVTSTEAAVCAKYGATSANLIDGKSGCDGVTPGGGDGDTGGGDGDTGGEDGNTGGEDGNTGGDDGDDSGSDDGDDSSEDGDDGDPQTVTIIKKEGCSVAHAGGNGWAALGFTALGLAMVARRRRR